MWMRHLEQPIVPMNYYRSKKCSFKGGKQGKAVRKRKRRKTKKIRKKNSGSNSNNNNNNIAAPAEGYEDGTYTGSAACSGEQFKEYSVTANVTIKNGKISAVEISSTAKGTNLKTVYEQR